MEQNTLFSDHRLNTLSFKRAITLLFILFLFLSIIVHKAPIDTCLTSFLSIGISILNAQKESAPTH